MTVYVDVLFVELMLPVGLYGETSCYEVICELRQLSHIIVKSHINLSIYNHVLLASIMENK